jgi:hypothetical protein
MRKLREALVTVGFAALDEQANVLGLYRSTAWTILNGSHKSYGLSATTVNRVLVAPRLPPLTRTIILEYVEEKKQQGIMATVTYGYANSPTAY